MNAFSIFLDIDGTLVPEGTNAVPKSAVSAMEQAMANGHYLFLNTGRVLANIDPFLKALPLSGMVLGCGTCIMMGQEVLYHHENDPAICEAVVKAVKECRLDVICESFHGLYYDDRLTRNEGTKRMLGKLKTRYTLESGELSGRVFDKFVTWSNPDSDLPRFLSLISPWFSYIDRGGNFSEFVPVGHSKATGMDLVLNHLSLPLSRSIAVGDSTNDLPMLSHAAHSVAMGNSDPASLKDMVEYVTTDIKEDGIRNCFTHFQLI